MDEILEEFKNKGVLRGLTYRFLGKYALAIIGKCREMNKVIYGIDVFEITNVSTQIIDYVDYSGKSYKEFDSSKYYEKYHVKKNIDAGHWEEASRFIKDRMNSGYYFEIVYEE
jgi:hypothetical protein